MHPAKLQFIAMLSETDKHFFETAVRNGCGFCAFIPAKTVTYVSSLTVTYVTSLYKMGSPLWWGGLIHSMPNVKYLLRREMALDFLRKRCIVKTNRLALSMREC